MRTSRTSSLAAAATMALAIASPSLARAQLAAGPEVDMDAPVLSPAPYSQVARGAASDGTNFLVALDATSGARPLYALVRADGTVATSPSLVVGSAPRLYEGNTVAYNGTTYGVATVNRDDSGRYVIDFARIGRDGTIADVPPIRVASARWISSLRLAATSTTWLFASHQDSDLVIGRVRSDGVVLGATPIVVSPSPVVQTALAGSEDGALLAYTASPIGRPAEEGVVAIDREGNILGTSRTLGTARADTLASTGIAYSSGRFLVAWLSAGGIDAVRVDAAGNPLDAIPISVVTPATDGGSQEFPVVVAQADGWLVAWNYHSRDDHSIGALHAARVSSAGTVIDTVPVALGGARPDAGAALAWNGSTTLVARSEIEPLGPRTVAFRISPSLAPLDAPATVGRWFNTESDVALSSGRRDVLAGWFDGRLGPSGAVAFLRLESDGTPRAAVANTIATTTDAVVNDLVIAASGTGYLAAWSELDWIPNVVRVRTIRLDAEGAPLDATPSTLYACTLYGDYCNGPAATFDGTDFLVAIGVRRSVSPGEVHVWRIGASGSPREIALPGITAANGNGISIASSGDGSLLAFVHTGTLSFERIARDGTVLDMVPQPFDASMPEPQRYFRLVAHGSEYAAFVSNGTGAMDVFRLAADGTMTRSAVTEPVWAAGPSISDTGENYFVTWSQRVAGDRETALAMRVGYDGVALDAVPIDLLPASDIAPVCRSAALPSSNAVLAYETWGPPDELPVMRIRTRTVPLPSPVADAGRVDGGVADATDDAVGGADAGFDAATIDVRDDDGGLATADVHDATAPRVDARAMQDAVVDGADDIAGVPVYDASCRCDLRRNPSSEGNDLAWAVAMAAMAWVGFRPRRSMSASAG